MITTCIFLFNLQESLLDRQEFLQWLLDLLEKSKTSDDVLLKFLIPLVSRVRHVYYTFASCQKLPKEIKHFVHQKSEIVLHNAVLHQSFL